jgi:hypothetical protein
MSSPERRTSQYGRRPLRAIRRIAILTRLGANR